VKQSAGLLLFKRTGSEIQVLIVHPGGPFWSKKDIGVWSIPKGEFEVGEEPIAVAYREFEEELGSPAPKGDTIDLGSVKQSSEKMVYAWALDADIDVSNVSSNLINIEWPPKSGKQIEIAEVDKAAWVDLKTAREKLVKGQTPLIDVLAKYLDINLDCIESVPEQKNSFLK
jgi:predicted NUDIX family NTP pyrophosphohydrolase